LKLAYTLAVHKNAEQVADLIRLVGRRGDYVLVHCNPLSGPAFRHAVEENCRIGCDATVFFARPRPVTWGGFSLTQVIVEGVRELVRRADDWSFAINLTGQCLPTQPIAALEEFLSGRPESNFLECFDIETAWPDAAYRFKRYYLDLGGRLINTHIPRPFPPRFFRPYGGCGEFILNRKFCEYVTESAAADRIVRYLRFAQLPDELWLQSVIMNSPYSTSVTEHARLNIFADRDSPNPNILTMRDWDQLISPRYFFARKFDPAVDKEVMIALINRVRPRGAAISLALDSAARGADGRERASVPQRAS
jgi:hypothetical protein